MAKEWQELTRMVKDTRMVIQRIQLPEQGITVEGEFELPPLAKLSFEDQVFAAAFIKSHGSIKQMEKAFGVSYPTIKARLNRLGESLDFVKVEERPNSLDVLDRLDRGELSVEEALRHLEEA